MKNITIKEFFEQNRAEDYLGDYYLDGSLGSYIDGIVDEETANRYHQLASYTDGFANTISIDEDGDYYVCGNECAYRQYFDDDVPMVEVVEYLIEEMTKDEKQLVEYINEYLYEYDEIRCYDNNTFNRVINYCEINNINYNADYYKKMIWIK
jgi:hypothetical protein